MTTKPNLRLQMLHDKLSNYLARIAAALPEEYKITLIARHPDNPKAHIVIGDDRDMEAVVYVLEHPELMPIETM
jgi:hypothetical protein